ncbi:MAG: hypothetical protein MUF63_16430, partial [Rhodobacteraceae bacterium]|nr:hypothetical protein [Paracoccaceae bacterium]
MDMRAAHRLPVLGGQPESRGAAVEEPTQRIEHAGRGLSHALCPPERLRDRVLRREPAFDPPLPRHVADQRNEAVIVGNVAEGQMHAAALRRGDRDLLLHRLAG